MNKDLVLLAFFGTVFVISSHQLNGQTAKNAQKHFQPLAYEQAEKKADAVLALMTLDEKIAFVGGDRIFFIRPLPRLNLPEVYMADATQGVHLRAKFREVDLSE